MDGIFRLRVVVDFEIMLVAFGEVIQTQIDFSDRFGIQFLFALQNGFRRYDENEIVLTARDNVPQKGDEFVVEENAAALAVGDDIRKVAVEKDDVLSLPQRQNFNQIADDVITAVVAKPDH